MLFRSHGADKVWDWVTNDSPGALTNSMFGPGNRSSVPDWLSNAFGYAFAGPILGHGLSDRLSGDSSNSNNSAPSGPKPLSAEELRRLFGQTAESGAGANGLTLDDLRAALGIGVPSSDGGAGSAAAAAAARDAAARKRIEEMYASMLVSLNRNADIAGSQIGTANTELVNALTALRDQTRRDGAAANQAMANMWAAQNGQQRQMLQAGLADVIRRGGDPTSYQTMMNQMLGDASDASARWNALTRSNSTVLNGQMQGQLASGRTLGTGARQQLANARVSAAAALDRQRLQALAQYGG